MTQEKYDRVVVKRDIAQALEEYLASELEVALAILHEVRRKVCQDEQ